MYGIFVVEDHPVMRQSLVALVNSQHDMSVKGEAGSAEEALEQMDRLALDLVLVDIALPGQDGIKLIKELAQNQPELPTVAVSGYAVELYGEAAFAAGARGYVMKQFVRELPDAIRQVLQGGTYGKGSDN